ncbi:MAG: YitT family protein [Actinomycetes bacterium]
MADGRQIPVTPWSARGSRWRAGPLTLAVLVVGLWLFGTAEALIVTARIGNSPWTVLSEGLARHTPLSIGGATFAISAVILLLWIPLREQPGLGTLANAVLIAVALGVGVRYLPRPTAPAAQFVQVVGGTILLALAGALYLTANLGPGPRDGLMTGLHERYGWRVAPVRTALEVSACAVGWALGGKVGIGTAVFALGVGPVLAWWLARLPRGALPVA